MDEWVHLALSTKSLVAVVQKREKNQSPPQMETWFLDVLVFFLENSIVKMHNFYVQFFRCIGFEYQIFI